MTLDPRRTEHLEEMVRTGRVYSKEEVRSMAQELLERRKKDPSLMEGYLVIPKMVDGPLDISTDDYTDFARLKTGQRMYLSWGGKKFVTVRMK